jgi:hypothetical protein
VKHPLGEVDVRPFERDHLTAPKPSITAEKNNEMGDMPHWFRRLDESFVLVEVVKVGFIRRDPQQLDGARHRPDHIPFDRDLQHDAQRCENRVDGRRRSVMEMVLEVLHIFVADRVDLSGAKQWNEMDAKD